MQTFIEVGNHRHATNVNRVFAKMPGSLPNELITIIQGHYSDLIIDYVEDLANELLVARDMYTEAIPINDFLDSDNKVFNLLQLRVKAKLFMDRYEQLSPRYYMNFSSNDATVFEKSLEPAKAMYFRNLLQLLNLTIRERFVQVTI